MLFQALMNYTITFVYQWHSSSTIKNPNRSGARIGKSQDPQQLRCTVCMIFRKSRNMAKENTLLVFFEALSFGII